MIKHINEILKELILQYIMKIYYVRNNHYNLFYHVTLCSSFLKTDTAYLSTENNIVYLGFRVNGSLRPVSGSCRWVEQMVSKGRFVQVKAVPMDTIRTIKNAISRLAEESIRLQELAAMVRRGKLAGNEADNLKMPFAEQYPVLSITAPKDGGGNKRGSFLPYAVKFTWNSLPVVKQQQFINHVLGYWKSLEKTTVSRIIMRLWRMDADRDRSVYIQFLEPDNVSQFKHLGKIKMSVLVGEPQVFKTDFVPVKAGLLWGSRG